MITLTAKINILPSVQGALSIDTHNLSGNNISSDIGSVVGVRKKGSNPFIIGVSKLGDGSTFSDGVDYFIGDQLSDGNGDFASPYIFDIIGAVEMSYFTFSFDTFNMRYPKEIKISSVDNNATTTFSRRVTLKSIKGAGISSQTAFSHAVVFKIPYSPSEVVVNTIKTDSGKEIYGSYTGVTINSWLYGGGAVRLAVDLEYENFPNVENLYITITCTFKGTENTYLDDDAVFTIADLPKSKMHSITISNWNTPYCPLVITGIYTEVDINIDYRNLISLQRTIYDRSDLKLPSFGIISNTGNIEFNDNDGEVRDYAEQLLLQSGLKCEINLNNTLVEGASEKIGLFETDQWNYDNDSRVVSVSLKDDLEEWQEINVATIEYDPRVIEHKPFSWLYEHLWKLTSNREAYVNTYGEVVSGTGNYNMLSLVELDEETQAVLNNTYIQYPLLESGSLWQQWTKLCEVCQLHIYKNNDGVIVCRYNGGN